MRRIAILKCWETNFALDPTAFLYTLPEKKYDWTDLERLVRQKHILTPDAIFNKLQQDYRFLAEMDADEAVLSSDPYRRERAIYQRVLASFK